eukprot:3153688-Prymnesium_polylepis.1
MSRSSSAVHRSLVWCIGEAHGAAGAAPLSGGRGAAGGHVKLHKTRDKSPAWHTPAARGESSGALQVGRCQGWRCGLAAGLRDFESICALLRGVRCDAAEAVPSGAHSVLSAAGQLPQPTWRLA